ncbi:MAG: methylenetetrahydrofolate--tRNA-(uracil(54)-C(5))-methyltransferase (FADH(2)-oxidizing) TrmFO [Thermodesulfobacteriales bacterium]
MSNEKIITVVGGGLAGSEAAHQIAKLGIKVKFVEMRPVKISPAHNSDNLGELVCSNSLKSDSLDNASGILKAEMRQLGSLIIEAADNNRVPAGKALAVDRIKFAEYITDQIESNPLIDLVREEFEEIPENLDSPLVIASGPLTSESLSESIKKLSDSDHLYFYDSISPIIDSESIDHSIVYKASRYEKGDQEEGDYLNCPLNRDQYYGLIDELLTSEKIETRDFEKGLYFESCLPVEVIAERGKDTLRFGPAKPVGLKDPRTEKIPYAVVQLRCENKEASMYNIVGFQTKLKYPEQRRVFRMIPGLEKAEFMRYGSMHRNTYINSPKLMRPSLQVRNNDMLFFAGQILGVEGYVESSAMGIIAGINAAKVMKGEPPIVPPRETALGSLIKYITDTQVKSFQPMNINFGLFPAVQGKMQKTEKKKLIAKNALQSISTFISR